MPVSIRRAIDVSLNAIWRSEGSHALLHHLNALFGYRPVSSTTQAPMRFLHLGCVEIRCRCCCDCKSLPHSLGAACSGDESDGADLGKAEYFAPQHKRRIDQLSAVTARTGI